MPAKTVGEVTPETILSQCVRMSNDSLHAFFDYSPHMDEENRVQVYVKLDGERIYNSYDSFGQPLTEVLQALIAIEYQHQEDKENV